MKLFIFALTLSLGSHAFSQSLPAPNFESVKANVFQPYCVQCHSAATGNMGSVNLETYANTITYLKDIQADVISNSMPKGRPPLPLNARDMLMAWIGAGAPEGASDSLSSYSTEDLVKEIESRGWKVRLSRKK